MSVNITIPSVGESISEGTIARWLKKDGERVKQGEPLYELETDKATTEVPAPTAGTLHISVPEGQTVSVGAAIGTLEEVSADREKPKKAPPKHDDLENDKPKTKKAKEAKREETHIKDEPKPEPARTPAPLSPAARRLSAERPEAATVPQTPVIHGDGRRHSPKEKDEAPAAEPPQAEMKTEMKKTGETRQPMSSIRQRIAQRLLASQQSTATLTTFHEADLYALQDLRGRYQDHFRARHGVKLGLTSFFVKACVDALRAYPVVNAHIDHSDVVYHDHCNIAVAVSTDKGLMAPVLHHAEQMSFADIEKRIAELAQKARAGKIAIEDLQGGTFTITNGGVFGSLLSTPILNPPQSAILGLHTIQKRPVVVNDQVVVRPMMYLALSYDHRLIDGRDAVGFLIRVKECIETPMRMMLDT